MQIMPSSRNRTVGLGCVVGLGAVVAALAAFPPADADEVPLAICDRLFVACGDSHTLSADESYDYVFIGQGGLVSTAGHKLTVEAVGGLIIAGGGRLDVNLSGGRVVLDVPWTVEGGTHIIDGQLRLLTSTSMLQINDNVVLAGGGRIVGTANDAQISVDARREVTSRVTIAGALSIGGFNRATTGTFVNEGLVHADRDNTPFIITLEDITFLGPGEWRVGNASPCVEINFASGTATGLWGDFTVLDGTLNVDVNLITSGRLHWVDGKIEVDSGVEFRAN